MLKKLISVLCILMLSITPVYANDNDLASNKVSLISSSTREISYEEAVDVLVEKANLTEKEAMDKLGQQERRTDTFVEHIEEFDYGDGSIVEVGALYDVWYQGSFRQLNGLDYCWSQLVSSGDTTYDEIYCRDMVTDYPCHDGHIKARGTVTRTISVSQEDTLGAELEGLGFSISQTTSSEIHYRKTQTMDMFYHLYNY